jgi:hypothetical protein
MDGDLNLFRLLRVSNGDWMTVGPQVAGRAVHVISNPNISFFDKNATPEAADRG